MVNSGKSSVPALGKWGAFSGLSIARFVRKFTRISPKVANELLVFSTGCGDYAALHIHS